ncbi:MAG: hypothetical protein KC933_33615 [Myxococcales bacterium]|nr:hypothetical protein [Myxococcales bacterium]
MTSRHLVLGTLLLLSLSGQACGDCPPGTVCEGGGFAEYTVRNLSSVELWVGAESAGATFETPLPMAVPPGMARVLATDGLIGVDPTPTDSFTWVTLSVADAQGVLQEVYRQEPMDAVLWTGGRVDGEDGYGVSGYVLEVGDRDLAL